MSYRSRGQASLKRLTVLARTSSPRWLRTAYRVARSMNDAPVSKPLPAELVKNCRVCASRTDLLYELPSNGVVAELGTLRGDFARKIVERATPRELHLIDVDYSQFNETDLTGSHIHRHHGLTDDVIKSFPDAYFDWIYIDADHSYNGTIADARASAPKVKPLGYIVFNDFAHIDPEAGRYGVHRAVVDFAIEANWPMAFFAYNNSALYDVALQKPANSGSRII